MNLGFCVQFHAFFFWEHHQRKLFSINHFIEIFISSQRLIFSIKQKEEQRDQKKIIVVSTHEADSNILEAVKNCEDNLKRTQSFRGQHRSLFKYVKKVGPNLKTHTNTLKHQALGIKRGNGTKCGIQGCKTCCMIMKDQLMCL